MPKTLEKCEEIRSRTKDMILRKSILYFAQHGFAGTKISELAKHIGIGQGSLYSYFTSKEDLFLELLQMINREAQIKPLKLLAALPISAKQKVHKMTHAILLRLENDEDFAGMIVLNTQMLLEENLDYSSAGYQLELYKYTKKIIEQGQKEGSVVVGTPQKIADYYWSVVFLYALKKISRKKFEMIEDADLERIILKGKNRE